MTTTNKTLKNFDSVKEYLNNLDDSELVSIHNEYCQNNCYSDDEIFINDEDFFNTYFEGKVLDAVRAVSFGEYSYSHDYVKFNGYGNLESFNSPLEHVDIESIAADILENPENYYGIELEECFEIGGTWYEGEEDEAKEQYEEYKAEIEESNEEAEEQESILSFEDWAKDNLTEIN